MSSSRANIQPMIFRQLSLPSSPDAIHEVEMVVEEIRQELDFKEDVYANVMVAVTEAVNNSIIHGNKSNQQKKVYVEFETMGNYRLLIRVHDEGLGFDPKQLDDPTAPQNIDRIGGRGVFLMRQLADRIDFGDNGRQVEMTFNI